jgi:transposase-like protein
MNPQAQFCPNPDCSARGQVGTGQIGIHSQKEKRYWCKLCGKTFSETTGTAVYGLKKAHETFWLVVTLLAYGCPLQAIVAAFGLDERTVADWQRKAGEHCQGVHEHVLGQSQLDLGQVQADEIKVKTQGGWLWMALAMMVSTRLWLGGVISPHRDKALVRALADQVRRVALCRPLLLAVDGLSSYVTGFRQAFRSPLHTGQPGRPRLLPWPNIAIVQVVKQRRAGVVVAIDRRLVQGCPAMIAGLLQATQNGGSLNVAFIERLNATFRQRLTVLTRRTRALARQTPTLEAAMYLLGCVYNFCTNHQSLRLPLYLTERDRRWVQRTPAMAAGLTDHRWTVQELLCFKVPPPPFVPPKRRGRPRIIKPLEAVA